MKLASRLLPAALATCFAFTAAAHPVINEIMYRPGSSYPENTDLEFIEIHNPDSSAVDLSGWALTDGVAYTFPASTTLPAGGFLVVAANPTTLASAGGFAGALGPWAAGNRLANDGETITLSQPDGDGGWTTVDTIDYADEGDWAIRTRDSLGGWSWITSTNTSGRSFERRNPKLIVDNGQNWGPSSAAGGSPGTANSVHSPNVAPVITNVKHAPAVPTSSDPVTISCRLTDESDASSLTAVLYWRNATTTSPGTFESTAMTGDGTGRFTATLAARADKQIVEFYVQSSDGTNTRTWPAPSSEGQNTNATFQVDNEVVSGTSPVYRLVLTAAENSAFLTTNAESDRQYNFTLIASRGADTTIRYLSSMRVRGNSSRRHSIKPLRIGLPSDNRWGGVKTFLIGSRAAPWQYLAHTLQRAAGLVAADVTPIEVRRQGVEYTVSSGSTADFGNLVRVEAFDSDYLDNHFPDADDAQIYRKVSITNWSAASTTAPSHPDSTWSGWTKESAKGANDWSDIITFSSTWQQVAASHFTGASSGNVASGTWNGVAFTDEEVATLATVADLDYLARWLAVMTIMPNNEPNLSTGEDDDYAGAFVSDGTHTRFYPLPHDMDTTFGTGEVSYPYNVAGLYDLTETDTSTQLSYRPGMPTTTMMAPFLPLLGNSTTAGNAAFRTKYLTAIRELLGSVFDADTSTNATPPFYQFADNHVGDWVTASALNAVKSFMTQRQTYLLGLIGAAKIAATTGDSTPTKSADSTPTLRLNEILVSNSSTLTNGATLPDVIELHNAGSSAVDLGGKRLGDSDDPTAYTFPSGTSLAAGAYLLVYADSATTESGLHTGFALDAEGDEVYLYDSTANGGALIDAVKFGFQMPDRTIARSAGDASIWTLTSPTLGSANGDGLTLGAISGVRINEWAGSIQIRTDKDFVELYNPSTSPVALGDAHLTDDLLTRPQRYEFRKLSFIPAGGFLLLDTDKLEFGLDGDFDHLYFTGANGAIIDQVDFSSQPEDYSTGRTTDGATSWTDFPVPTPGLSNTTSLPANYTALLANLRITEIMYDPDTSAQDEFVELQNIGSTTLELGGVRFTNGISYTFAAGTTLAPGAQLVVCRNRTSFLTRYPDAADVLATGTYSGALDNSGETLALSLPSPWNLHVLKFRYDPSWYPLTSTDGYSLVVPAPATSAARDWDESWTWAASSAVGGNPGGFAATTSAITLTSASTATAAVNQSFAYQITTSETATAYAATGLPSGLSLNATSGAISGTPSLAGSYAVTLTVSTASSTGYATLTITVAPAIAVGNATSISADAGTSTTLSVTTVGASIVTYQWQKLTGSTWTSLSEATASTYTLTNLQSYQSGTYRVLVTANGVATPAAVTTISVAGTTSSASRLMNLSTRGLSLTGADALIPGFVIDGTGTKQLLIRTVGPTLGSFGVEGTLVDPGMTLKRYDTTAAAYVDVATNDNWSTNSNLTEIITTATRVGAFALTENSADAALLVDLVPGQYSVVTTSPLNATDVAIVELYDADTGSPSTRLLNISTRGYVGTGSEVMVSGFVISEEGPRTVLVRAVGPGLANFGVSGVLTNPRLSLYQNEQIVLSNDDWSSATDAANTASVASQVGAFALESGSRDAAFVATLAPGSYTVQADGVDSTTGIAIIEVYLVP